MKMSVVVPTYNLGSYLAPLLQDLTKQTHSFELWLVDDGSTDGTQKQIVDFARGVPNFHAVQLMHEGVSVARNYGLKRATGDGIVFVDGDDLITSNFIEILAQGLEQGAVLVSVGYEWYRRPQNQTDTFIELDQKAMFDQAAVHGSEIGGYIWNKAFSRKAILEANLMFDESLHIAEDYLFTTTFVAKTPGKYLYWPRVLYTKRNRPDSTLHRAQMKDRQEEDTVFQRIHKLKQAFKV